MLVEKSFHRIDPGLAWLELPCAKIVEDKAIERPKPDFGFIIDIGGDRQQVGFNLRRNAHFVKKIVSSELDQDHCIHDHQTVVSTKSVSVRVDLGGQRLIQTQTDKYQIANDSTL